MTIENDPPADTRSMRDLAEEVIRIQGACNISGLAWRFPHVLSRLRTLLTKKYGAGPSTNDINEHPITRAWVDKLASLAGVQAWEGYGHDRAKKAHGDCLDLAQDYRFNAGTDTTK